MKIIIEQNKAEPINIETLEAGDCFWFYHPNTNMQTETKNGKLWMVIKNPLETKDYITIVRLSDDFETVKRGFGYLVVKEKTTINILKEK